MNRILVSLLIVTSALVSNKAFTFDHGNYKPGVLENEVPNHVRIDDLPGAMPAIIIQPGQVRRWRVTANFQSAAHLRDVLDALAGQNVSIDAMAASPVGHWVIVTPGVVYQSAGFPSAVRSAVDAVHQASTVRAIAFNQAGGWVVASDTLLYTGGSVPQDAIDNIDRYQGNGWGIGDIVITNNGFLVVDQGGSRAFYSLTLPAGLREFIFDRRASRRRVRQVEIGFDGRWVVVADQEWAASGISSLLRNRMETSARSQHHVSRLMLGLGNDYVVYSHGTVQPTPGNPMEAIEYNLAGQNLWQWMLDASVPGLSIVLIDNNEVIFARGYGVLRAGEFDKVVATTPFGLASLSKYLGALVILHRAFPQLDRDILYQPWGTISSWQHFGEQYGSFFSIPNVDLPDGMSLRRLLRHQAGIRAEGGSPGFPGQQWNNIPSDPLNLLLGYTCSSSSCGYSGTKYVWTDPSLVIGDSATYASGNFLLAEAVIEDITGTSGADLLDHHFFGPMGLDDISAQVPPMPAFLARTAWQHGNNGPVSSRTVYPWVFAGGVHASASDYAEMMILALNQGRDSTGTQRVSSSRIAAMLSGGGIRRGFGLRIERPANAVDSAGEGTDHAFFHGGSHGGRTRSWMCGNPTRNQGIVILANARTDQIDSLVNVILDRYVATMGWPAYLNCR